MKTEVYTCPDCGAMARVYTPHVCKTRGSGPKSDVLAALEAARDAVQRMDTQDAFAAIDRAKAIVAGL